MQRKTQNLQRHLPFSQDGVLFVWGLPRAERLRRGTRTASRVDTKAAGCDHVIVDGTLIQVITAPGRAVETTAAAGG